jgi:hypothetical protein
MLAYLYVIVAIAFRLVPHPALWNFTPLAASLLYFGARTSRKQIWFPVLALAATDVLLNRFAYHVATDISFLFTWAWYAGMVLLGSGMLAKRTTVARVVGASLTGSVSFFLVSNFFVWATGAYYPHTLAGLLTCLTAGQPAWPATLFFFRHTVTGDVLFSALMFGLPAVVHATRRRTSAPRLAA